MFINSFIDCVCEEQHTSSVLPTLFLFKKTKTRGHILKAREKAFGRRETKMYESKEFLRKEIVIE